MRTRKELIYLNIKNLTQEEIEKLGDCELNCCDICGEIDLSMELCWIDGEYYWDNPTARKLVEKGNCAVCRDCLENENF